MQLTEDMYQWLCFCEHGDST